MGGTTRRLLVAFDPDHPTRKSSDFLIPYVDYGAVTLWGLKSQKPQMFGLVVLTSQTVAAPDLFARLVDTDTYVDDLDAQVAAIESFIEGLRTAAIGAVYTLTVGDAGPGSITLKKTPFKASEPRPKLP